MQNLQLFPVLPLKKQFGWIILIFFMNGWLRSQPETAQWRFGKFAAVDFFSTPPVSVSGSSTNCNVGTTSIADASGALLFYSDGATVWNQANLVMANGSGLMGGGSNQSGIVVKKPGSSTLYYLFAIKGLNLSGGCSY